MYIITEKKTKTLLAVGNELSYHKIGFLSILDKSITFPKAQVNVYEVDELPEGVGIASHCYAPAAGFYDNPHFGDNEKTAQDKWAAEILQEVSSYEY